ncbi:MAG: adenylosuccinate synthase [Dehalococcoidia bacterium]
MPIIAIVGAQWGDEGKGKIVDLLARKANMVVRYSGGNNAGHTVLNDLGEFKLHLVPAGAFNPQAVCVIGNGVVINPQALLEEVQALEERGVNLKPGERLCISDRAHLIMPYHLLLDELEEKARGEKAIGTTRKGIGPAYMDKTARMGIRTGDLLDRESLKERLDYVMDHKNAVLTKLYGAPPLSTEEVYQECCRMGERLGPYLRQTEVLIREAMDRGDTIIMEGAQGTLLDSDFGTYPYVTSSAPIAAGSALGAGISPAKIDSIIGVYKAYTTRVGSGPMPTEMFDSIGEQIRERAMEYGATTGRPRRCGWFDAVVGRYSTMVNGYTSMVLTRLDVLDELPAVKVCTAYRLNGTLLNHPPSSSADLYRCEPVYEELAGWRCSTREARAFEDLPPEARFYVKRLEELVGCPVDLIAVGPRRDESIFVQPLP